MNKNINDIGIILRRKPFSESDLLLTIFSKNHGKIVILTKGSRKIKSKFMGHFEPFCLVKFSCLRGKSFFIMTSLETLDSHSVSKENPENLKVYSYISEVIDVLTPELENNGKLFLRLNNYLKTKDIAKVSVADFLFDILEFSGFAPSIIECAKCGKSESLLNHFSFYWGGLVCKTCSQGSSAKKVKIETIKYLKNKSNNIKNTESETREIRDILKSFVEYINENKIKTSKFI